MGASARARRRHSPKSPGRPLFTWALAALDAAATIDRAVIAYPPDWEEAVEEAARAAAPSLAVSLTPGGTSRSHSVKNALAAIEGADEILVHDAARPLVTPELIDRCVEQRRKWGCDGVVAAARAVDTIKEADAGGRVIATLERSHLWAIQTPQVFTAEHPARGARPGRPHARLRRRPAGGVDRRRHQDRRGAPPELQGHDPA